MSATWREEVEQSARSWMFTPYQHKGRVRGVGVDCGGLLYEVYNPIFGPFPAFPNNYAPDWALHRSPEHYLAFIMPFVRQIDAPIAGGFSLFKYGRNFSHAGIYTARGTYIHAYGSNKSGSVRESSPRFFRIGNKDREVMHFDVNSATLERMTWR